MTTILDSIVTRLTDYLATAFDPPLPADEHPKVEHFPDNVERYQFRAARTTLLVGHDGATYTAPPARSMAPVSQDRRREISITILARSLRKPEGVNAMIDLVRRALLGWSPPQGDGPFMMVRDAFVGEDQGTWRFVVIVEHTSPVVAEMAPRTGPAITKVTIRNPDDPRPPPPEPEP